MELSLKERKEAHVTGLLGTTKMEVSAITTVPTALLLLHRLAVRHDVASRVMRLPAVEWLLLAITPLACELDFIGASGLLLLTIVLSFSILLLSRNKCEVCNLHTRTFHTSDLR